MDFSTLLVVGSQPLRGVYSYYNRKFCSVEGIVSRRFLQLNWKTDVSEARMGFIAEDYHRLSFAEMKEITALAEQVTR